MNPGSIVFAFLKKLKNPSGDILQRNRDRSGSALGATP